MQFKTLTTERAAFHFNGRFTETAKAPLTRASATCPTPDSTGTCKTHRDSQHLNKTAKLYLVARVITNHVECKLRAEQTRFAGCLWKPEGCRAIMRNEHKAHLHLNGGEGAQGGPSPRHSHHTMRRLVKATLLVSRSKIH